ncbi:MAG: helix-hairpin-helix domain-containing protein, partial [Methanosphaera sp.]|nr:helix-hairpin-helix domain-containing protein [Methanosphaera sp.]
YNNTDNYNNNYYDQIVNEYSPKEKIKLPNKPVPTPKNPYQEKPKPTKKYPYRGKKINVNTADITQLKKIPHVGENRAKIIISYRSNNKIESLSELTQLISLARSESRDIEDCVIFDEPINNQPSDTEESLNQILNEIRNERNQLKKERDEFNKRIDEKLNVEKDDANKKTDEINNKKENDTNLSVIDINTATEDELKNLPGINVIKAKKIIQLRESGIYIKSWDDLQDKLNLKDYELEQIKAYAKINIQYSGNHIRRLDL